MSWLRDQLLCCLSLLGCSVCGLVGVKDATFRNVLCERIFTERVLTKDEDKFKTLLGLSDRGVAMIQQVTESKEIRDDMVMTSAIHTNNVTIVNTSSSVTINMLIVWDLPTDAGFRASASTLQTKKDPFLGSRFFSLPYL